MVDKDIVFEKVKQIQRSLRRIQDKTQGKAEMLDDFDVQDVFVLNLQRAIQSTFDLASHVIADEALGLPSELSENFTILEQKRIIGADLSARLKRMVGFRSIAVHEYAAIDPEVLKSILKKDLKDLEEFYSLILKTYQLA